MITYSVQIFITVQLIQRLTRDNKIVKLSQYFNKNSYVTCRVLMKFYRSITQFRTFKPEHHRLSIFVSESYCKPWPSIHIAWSYFMWQFFVSNLKFDWKVNVTKNKRGKKVYETLITFGTSIFIQLYKFYYFNIIIITIIITMTIFFFC